MNYFLLFGGALAALATLLYFMPHNLIKKFEGLSLTPYQDAAGYWTIGYGHKILDTDPYAPYGPITEITQDQANALLDQDTAAADSAITAAVIVPLTKNQHDALESFVFNVGPTAFDNSTLLALLNSGDYAGAAAEFDKWIHAGGVVNSDLVARRAEEKQLFLA
jgi:lysozyme